MDRVLNEESVQPGRGLGPRSPASRRRRSRGTHRGACAASPGRPGSCRDSGAHGPTRARAVRPSTSADRRPRVRGRRCSRVGRRVRRKTTGPRGIPRCGGVRCYRLLVLLSITQNDARQRQCTMYQRVTPVPDSDHRPSGRVGRAPRCRESRALDPSHVFRALGVTVADEAASFRTPTSYDADPVFADAPGRQDRRRARPWTCRTGPRWPWPTRRASPGYAWRLPASPSSQTSTPGRANTVAVVTDGTAVLGLGDIGPAAAMPVMEGKALLFKHFAGVDAVPICLDCTDSDEAFGRWCSPGAELRRHQPRRHLSAALLRAGAPAARRAWTSPSSTTTSTAPPSWCWRRCATPTVDRPAASAICGSWCTGAGAAGIAVTKILLAAGIGDIAVADSKGMLHAGREGLTPTSRRRSPR